MLYLSNRNPCFRVTTNHPSSMLIDFHSLGGILTRCLQLVRLNILNLRVEAIMMDHLYLQWVLGSRLKIFRTLIIISFTGISNQRVNQIAYRDSNNILHKDIKSLFNIILLQLCNLSKSSLSHFRKIPKKKQNLQQRLRFISH